jgi:hypothetical protein
VEVNVRWVILFVVVQAALLALLAFLTLNPKINDTNVFALILVGSVVFLMTSLFIIAGAFAQLNLTDRRQALGLPEGSIRAMIALILILVFIMFGSLLYSGAANPEEQSRLGQQLLTTIGTLVVAVAGFYFGSATTASATAAGAANTRDQGGNSTPVVTGIEPRAGNPGAAPLRLMIHGANFQPPTTVRLVRNGEQLIGNVVEQTPTSIAVETTLAGAGTGRWDLVVENADGSHARQPRAFEVQPPSA